MKKVREEFKEPTLTQLLINSGIIADRVFSRLGDSRRNTTRKGYSLFYFFQDFRVFSA